jgi:6-phosphogluconolactonase
LKHHSFFKNNEKIMQRELIQSFRYIRYTALAFSIMTFSAAQAKTMVYVSSAQDGRIDSYVMNEHSGTLKISAKTAAGKLVMPMAVSPNSQYLYAVVRSKPFSIVTYKIDTQTGALTQQAKAPLPDSMAYISRDTQGRYLFTASYGGNKIAVNPIDPTGIATQSASQVIPTGIMAHCIIADRSNKYVFATNLGSNQILQFRLHADSGQLTPNQPALIKFPANHGPRHMAIAPDNKFMYVMNELSGDVTQLAIGPQGTLTYLSDTSTVPASSGLLPGLARDAMPATATSASNTKAALAGSAPRIWAADIKITPNGKYIYTSERTSSKIALLSINPLTGKPAYITNYSSEKQPRGINIDPTGKFLAVTGEKSDRLSIFRIHPRDGHLTLIGRYPVGLDATWVEFVNLP